MKLSGQRAEAFLRAPDPRIVAILLYGPDRGLVRERAARIVAALVGGPADPFRVTELSAGVLEGDRARLADEVASIPFGGGNRVVRVRDAADGIAPSVRSLLEGPVDAGAAIIEAGELGPRSALRSLCEEHARAASIACYLDEGEDLRRFVETDLRARGIALSPEAAQVLESHLGADRALTRQELEKLALYVGEGGRIGAEDVRAVVSGAGTVALDEIAFAAAGGSCGVLDEALRRAAAEGASAIALLRAVARHLQRLIQARKAVEGGASASRAMESLRPAVFFRLQPEFRRQLQRWTIDDLSRALAMVVDAEARAKSGQVPQELTCHAALFELAALAAGVRPTG